MTEIFVLALLGAGAGLIAGSFIAALVLRLPLGESVADGRSRCDQCRKTLRWFELVPLLSWLALRGRCARCSAPIDPLHPAIEAACAVIGAASFLLPQPSGAIAALFGWWLLLVAVVDARHFWLPDRLTLPLAAAGCLISAFTAAPGLLASAFGGLAGFGLLWAIATLYRRIRGHDGLGGGDPKLLGAIGAWCGWAVLPMVVLLACATGLAWILLSLVRGQRVTSTDRLPFGTLLALAAWPVWVFEAVIAR